MKVSEELSLKEFVTTYYAWSESESYGYVVPDKTVTIYGNDWEGDIDVPSELINSDGDFEHDLSIEEMKVLMTANGYEKAEIEDWYEQARQERQAALELALEQARQAKAERKRLLALADQARAESEKFIADTIAQLKNIHNREYCLKRADGYYVLSWHIPANEFPPRLFGESIPKGLISLALNLPKPETIAVQVKNHEQMLRDNFYNLPDKETGSYQRWADARNDRM
jgi:hypothetical protein